MGPSEISERDHVTLRLFQNYFSKMKISQKIFGKTNKMTMKHHVPEKTGCISFVISRKLSFSTNQFLVTLSSRNFDSPKSRFLENSVFLQVDSLKLWVLEHSILRRIDFSKIRFFNRSIPRNFDFSKIRFTEKAISRKFRSFNRLI